MKIKPIIIMAFMAISLFSQAEDSQVQAEMKGGFATGALQFKLDRACVGHEESSVCLDEVIEQIDAINGLEGDAFKEYRDNLIAQKNGISK
jgi:hypothetical protein